MENKNRATSKGEQKVTLILSRTEASQVLAVLKHAEDLVNLLDPKGTQNVPGKQNFLGKLIKKVGGAITKVSKSTA